MSRLLASLLALPLPLAAASPSAPRTDAPYGEWEVAGAHLTLAAEEGVVVGRLAAEGGPCKVAVGAELLRGALLDDSLSAQVRLCLVAPECADDPSTALAVLLVSKQLTGGVHTRNPCAAGARALVLRRPNSTQALRPPPKAGERLSRAHRPKRPRKIPPKHLNAVARGVELNEQPLVPESVTAGEIADRPVGEPPEGEGYDPRAARKAKLGEPRTPASLMTAGKALLDAGRFERARAAFLAAVAQQPARVEAYNGVGVTYYARGDLDEALAWYKRSLDVDPNFGDAFYNMACVYAVDGKKELAFRYLRLAALNGYAGREQIEEDPDLAALRGEPQMAEIVASMPASAPAESAKAAP
jgi:hypothetical protein